MDNSLEELVPRYYEMKKEMESYKPQVDADNKAIKSIMRDSKISKFETLGEYTASFNVIDKSYFDETKLLVKLKSLGRTTAIKTKEYVDMDVVENMLYNGELTPEDIKDCKVEKYEERLTVKKEAK